VPALVAITQTSILGDRRRRISTREAARLQGLPEWFDFGSQPDAATYRQLGNGVNVGAAYHVLREHVLKDVRYVGRRAPHVAEAISGSPSTPDAQVERIRDPGRTVIVRHRTGHAVEAAQLEDAG
jgi:DNA (cytosine-5)-methyltransferase 1